MPVAVIIEAPGWLEHPVQFPEARLHISYVSGDVFKFIPELPFFSIITCGAIAAVGIEWRVDIDKVDALIREGFQLNKAILAVDEAGFHINHCITRDIAIVDGIKYN